MATTDTDEDILFSWRTATFEDLGFDEYDARLLAGAKRHKALQKKGTTIWYETYLHALDVKAALAAGCSRNLILQIFV